ncbi:MAG: MarR family transcriptional regulator [Clostridiales bacterium]|nr:MarR family transcriptional regulator [Clostridiales bacterium]
MGEFTLLMGISNNSPCRDNNVCLSDIHSHLHVTKPAVSQMLNSLEKRGFILREIDKNDRRKISILLTQKGQAALTQAKEYMDQRMDLMLTRFGTENALQLIALLNILADVTEDVAQSILSQE